MDETKQAVEVEKPEDRIKLLTKLNDLRKLLMEKGILVKGAVNDFDNYEYFSEAQYKELFTELYNQTAGLNKRERPSKITDGIKGLFEDEKKAKEADLKKEYEQIAVRRVKLGLLLAEIANQNKVTLSGDDMTKAISQEASRYPGSEKKVFEFYQKNPRAMDALRAQLFEDKVIDFVATQIKTKEKKMTPEELYAFDPDKK